MMQMQRFNVTVHNKPYQTKPGQVEVASHIRRLSENTIQSVNIYELAAILGRGQSVVLGVHDLNHGEKKYTSKDTFLYQEVFSVDIDHGNFTFEELKQRLSELPFPHALIYKTFSYEETSNKRWRVVFLSDKRYTNREDVSYINRYLVYMMAKDFESHGSEWVEIIDRQSIDCSRINFGGKPAEVTPHQVAHLDVIFTPEHVHAVLEFEAKLQNAIKSLSDERKGSGVNQTTKEQEKSLKMAKNEEFERKIIPHADDVVKMSDQICSNLELLAYALPNKPDCLDFQRRYDFINELPLSMLLDVRVGQEFNCVLPDHHDKKPSANLMYATDGTQQERYHCFGCMEEGKVYKPFNLIATLFEAAYNLTTYGTLQLIYEKLNIQLGSPYQRKVIAQLEHDVSFVDTLPEDDPFYRKLDAKNLNGFYKAFMMLARQKVSYEPMVKDQECIDMVFFASNSYIQEYARKRWGLEGIKNISSVNRKINFLVALGVVEKVAYKDLKPMMREKSKAYIEKVRQEEAKVLGPSPRRYPDYYRLRFLTPKIIEQACRVMEFNKTHAGRSQGQSAKQAKGLYGEVRAKEIHLQSSMTYNKKEQRFLNESRPHIVEFLNDRGYFTEKELLRKIDPKGNHFKMKDKQNLSLRLLPELLTEFKLVKVQNNKKYREYYQIPTKITGKHHVIFHQAVYELLNKK